MTPEQKDDSLMCLLVEYDTARKVVNSEDATLVEREQALESMLTNIRCIRAVQSGQEGQA